MMLVALGLSLFWVAIGRVPNILSPYLLNLCVPALSLSTVGALIASRRTENLIGWLFCASGLLFSVEVFAGEYGTYALLVERGSLPAEVVAWWLASWVWIPAALLVLFLFLLFPDGRLPSPRWRIVAWLIAGGILLDTASVALVPGQLIEFDVRGLSSVENPFGFESVAHFLDLVGIVLNPLVVVIFLAPIVALFLRFRRAYETERQQIKWVLYAAAVLTVSITVVSIWPALDVSRIGTALFLVGYIAIPTTIAIAILRHRLYDIDFLVNRTLLYGALTVILALIYLGGVTATQVIFRVLTGQEGQPQLAIVVSTLVIAALFNPLRLRIQSFIDRSFYRSKYDARKTLEAFSAKLRDETDLNALTDDLVGVVKQTMQPAHVSVWLHPDPALKDKKKRATIRESGHDEQ